MSIQETLKKLKGTATDLILDDAWFTIALVLLVGITAFGLGRVSVHKISAAPSLQKGTVIESGQREEKSASSTGEILYVASKNGTKYHLPWCGSAKQISEKNKITFTSKEAAEAAGYTPAANCPGI